MSEAEELSVAKLVSKSLGEVVQIAQSKSSFVEGKPFVLLCETWASFAKRVNIARALYYDPEIVIFDDPFSAVDAHVGKSLFQGAIVDALRNHHIYTMNNGVIMENGTYDELITRGGDYARLDLEFGGHAFEGKKDGQAEEAAPVQAGVTIEDAKLKSERARASGSGKLEGRLTVKEKRSTGSVSWEVYWTYFVAGRGSITGPLVLFSILAMQGSQILNSYTLTCKFDRPNSFYQMLYGCLGVGQAAFTFLVGAGMDVVAFYVSQNLHHKSARNVFYAPMSFFDTAPMSRILSVFGKDIDSIDNQLAPVLTLSGVVDIICEVMAHVCLVIGVFFIFIGYSYLAAFYRASAREVKRLDSMLRSLLYAHFSETLTGLPTIRSYGEMKRFIAANRLLPLYLLVTNQRWLAIRLEFAGGVLVFLLTNVSGINPAQIGLILTYTISLTQSCGVVIILAADVENYMNAVERPPAQWPEHGAVDFNNVMVAYRPGLPNVLRGISVKVRGGEKIGVIGRTGAGKSSLMLSLFRIVELSGGSVAIDGVDISTIGLTDLRSKISIIPQDPILFSGTIRSNLDPFAQHGDAELWDALHRSCLVDSSTTSKQLSSGDCIKSEQTSTSRHDLDSTIESEDANLSVGERSLLSLARALVKDCRIVVLDEATASVDLETDRKIQHTIQTEFKGRTLLCIAHRLRTIISYDRILVLDAGLVASNLFKMESGIFCGMCERSNISLKDVETSRQV
ncbi:putative YOR1-ABC transporter [Suillus lakei]|nr:putative YOR1-ABC transporter [Suillus lakei]